MNVSTKVPDDLDITLGNILSTSDPKKLDSLSLPPLNPSFYTSEVNELVPLAGSYEHGHPKFEDALRRLNEIARLGLNEININAIAHALTLLSDNKRFSHDPNLESIYGENPAIHSIHCVPLAIEMFRRSGLAHDKEFNKIRLAISLGVLIHDMGESLGEFSSLSQRTTNTSIVELPEIERKIFSNVMHYALFISENPIHASDFSRDLYTLKNKTKVVTGAFRDIDTLNKTLDKFKDEILSQKYLSDNSIKVLSALLRIYDTAELNSNQKFTAEERFIGYAVKIIEHSQGTRHLLRFISKDTNHIKIQAFSTPIKETKEKSHILDNLSHGIKTSIPAHYSHSLKITKGLAYQEYGLGELFDCIKDISNHNEKFLVLAKHIRNAVYETNIEFLSLMNPVYNRKADNIPAEITRQIREIHSPLVSQEFRDSSREELKAALKSSAKNDLEELRALRKNLTKDQYLNNLFDYETEIRLISLYRNAISKDYIPQPNEVLASIDTLREELKPLGVIRASDMHKKYLKRRVYKES